MVEVKDLKVLITGGSGALGSALVKTLHEAGAERVVCYSRSEYRQQLLAESMGLNIRGDGSGVRMFLGDVRDKRRLTMAMWGITHVIHAAALKIVPAGEYNPDEFIKTNVVGAMNVIEAAIETGVERVIGVSTDKAVSPVNLYGATKLCAEKAFVAANALAGGRTKFGVCRYGNVTGSTGSVVPIWTEAAKAGRALKVTDPSMTRYYMQLHEAVRFVLDSLRDMEGGEVFIPKLPSYVIADLARAVYLEARGVTNDLAYNDDPHTPTEIIGIRPGEKMHESMIAEDESPWCHEDVEGRRYILAPENALPKVPQGFRYRSDENDDTLGVEALRHELRQLGND